MFETTMTSNRMHADELTISLSLVYRLIAAQFPRWAHLPLRPVPSTGTDNALYRLGDELVVRLPRINWAADLIDKEWLWLPKLAPYLPFAIPVPLAQGEPDENYPWRWAIFRWIEGDPATIDPLPDPEQTAIDLAAFITALQRIDATDGPPPGADDLARGKPLALRDPSTRQAITALDGMIDARLATVVWEDALRTPVWDCAPVWFHGDLLPGNLLFWQGRLHAVIDFGTLGVGDPACDLMVAWNLFSRDGRKLFRDALGVDEATWARGRGWALSQALIFIPYYLYTNPIGVSCAQRTIEEVLADDHGCAIPSWRR
ncbi:aminoglycoside phosphotransferase [Roseiflexus castenholzii DSM 13941]|uniref:Aminoglycoside phosphotransferase n=2 Tax=Roseiflexus castenholzii TaxID=120962 RepID=A7NRQ1_ROSCS|nr:aminoglycoside phosphotransferase [Roseiflexus castenholzii DSM 13941]